MQTTSIKIIDNRHNDWKLSLGFYEDELNIFKTRLNEVAGKNTGKEVGQMVEHFQNQFLIQAEHIDLLQHDINEYLSSIVKEVAGKAGHIGKDQVSMHFSLHERVEKEGVIFNEIKKEFMNFLSKVM